MRPRRQGPALLGGPSTSPLDAMLSSRSLLCLGVLLSSPASLANGPCLSYEPANVTLRGTLAVVTFPGANGLVERNVMLQLDQPICIEASSRTRPEDRVNTSITDVRQVTLVFATRGEEDRALSLPPKIRVSGSLWRAVTGHFAGDVAMSVRELRQDAS